MRGFFAIARRGILERRFVFAAAAVGSLLALALPNLRGATGFGPSEVRSWAAVLLGVALVLALAVGLGVSMLAPSIADRRIGFDLSRPISSAALWGGTLAAALVIAGAAAAIIAIPAWLAGARIPWNELRVEGRPPGFAGILAIGGFLVLVAAAHAASVMVRSRSKRIVLDAVLAVATVLVLLGSLSRLPSFFADEARGRAVWIFAVAAGAGLLAAGLASVERGRTDIRAAHRALSTTLWSSIGVALAGVIGWTGWVLSAGPRDLTSGFWVSPAPAGHWVLLQGRARQASATFLWDLAGGRSERALVVNWAAPAISGDGRVAAWVEGRSDDSPYEVLAMPLDRPDGRPAGTRILLHGNPSLFVLSFDGSRLATLEEDLLSVHDLVGGATLVSARVQADRTSLRGLFDGNDRFRVYRQPEAGDRKTHLEIFELDVAGKALTKTGELERESASLYFVWNATGDRLLTLPEGWLVDGRSGAILGRLAPETTEAVRGVGFLADDRPVVAESSSLGARMRVFRPDGAPEKTIPLPPGRALFLGGEVAPAQVVVAIGEGPTYSSHLVDVDRGTVRRLADGLFPAARLNGSYPNQIAPGVGSEATRLFIARGFVLVKLDPATGAQTVLLGSSSPHSAEPTQ
jgi:hypothetical protein